MKQVGYIKTIGSNIILLGIALLLLGPQVHTVCFRDCSAMETPAPACSCHNDVPLCCMMEKEEPATPMGCDCEACLEVQLPAEYFPAVPIPQPTRYDQVYSWAPLSNPGAAEFTSLAGRYLSPLDFENRFLSQIDDQLASTVIIA